MVCLFVLNDYIWLYIWRKMMIFLKEIGFYCLLVCVCCYYAYIVAFCSLIYHHHHYRHHQETMMMMELKRRQNHHPIYNDEKMMLSLLLSLSLIINKLLWLAAAARAAQTNDQNNRVHAYRHISQLVRMMMMTRYWVCRYIHIYTVERIIYTVIEKNPTLKTYICVIH